MEQSREFAVGQLCRVLGVSRSGFYAWRRRPRSERDRQSTILVDRIRAVHRESRGIYGSPRVYRALRSAGYAIGKHRVARLMQLEGLRGRAARRFRFIATRRSPDLPAAPNRIARNFTAEAPNHLWLADITQVRTREGWLFLAILLDAFSRRIVGWATSARPEQAVALEALHGAVARRRPAAGLVHHSDRGGSYASANYQELLDQHGMVCSMSRPGNCLDNAPAESFSTPSRPSGSITSSSTRASRRAAVCSSTSRASTTARGSIPRSGTARRNSMRNWSSLNPVSTFSGEHQAAVAAS